MADFPALQHAFTIEVEVGEPLAVGSASRTNPLQVVPMTGGTVKSAPGFAPGIDAEFVGVGNDYIHADPDTNHARLDAHSVLKTQDGALLYLHYTGVLTLSPVEKAVLGGKAEDGPTPFGNIFAHFRFETGDDRYRELENRVFVGQGRFVVRTGKPTVVEYRVSQVVQG
ncbi:hypothetical protein N7510_004454 [Penicillium lagena]|uniref:uncharacterized protein n=1 Tax=Penicillium lagena TaxID=94218 RepID=UPI0025412DDD|nr:uncharacterized protein N7510_004454 [Penicillium lagena]KAJ5620470.1 hypothetical protein N7510_004454 [Penicillium lagena]